MDEQVQPELQPPPVATSDNSSELMKGLGLIWLLNVAQLIVGVITLMIGIGAVIIAAFGLVQLAYVIPLALRAKRTGNRGRMKGMIIAGCVTFLLSIACWGVVIGSLSGGIH